MKTQAWGWLAAAVLAAGLNASYHDGGLPWAHQIADEVGHRTNAVLALATGHVDEFLAEARVMASEEQAVRSMPEAALARVEIANADCDSTFSGFQAMSAREQAQMARLEARRVRMQARFAHMRIPAVAFNPVVMRMPEVKACPRIHVNIPRMPQINVPAVPEIHLDLPGTGPV